MLNTAIDPFSKIIHPLLLLIALGSILGCQAPTSQSPPSDEGAALHYHLKLNFEEDITFEVKEDIEISSFHFPGEEQEFSTFKTIVTQRKLNLAPPNDQGQIMAKVSYLDRKVTISDDSGIIYAIDEGDPTQKSSDLPRLTGKRAEFKLDARSGHITEVIDHGLVPQAFTGLSLEDSIARNYLKACLNPEWAFFPKTSIPIGGTWSISLPDPCRGQVRNSTYTLVQVADEIATVTFTDTILPLDNADIICLRDKNGAFELFKAKGNASGELKLNTKTGLLLSKTELTELDGFQLHFDGEDLETKRLPIQLSLKSRAEYSY